MGRAGRSAGERLQSPLDFERELWSRGIRAVAGVDEVGRGPLAGPVVAAAVVLPPECIVCGADDSKRLSARQRDELAREVVEAAAAVGIGAASAVEVDRLNIRRATALAMQRAIRQLGLPPEHLLVDGLPVPELGLEGQTAVVGGDHLVHSISCASIVAKVCRDRLMQRLAARYPRYGWERNKGYGTPEHREALRRFGATPHHRRSFQPVEQLSLIPDPDRAP
ncbi:MAG TPA: ribonuclease HII [Longimicrobiaceae bacterium]|nr:ribonuclease HII [Longimicrobiaceae bacterium]